MYLQVSPHSPGSINRAAVRLVSSDGSLRNAACSVAQRSMHSLGTVSIFGEKNIHHVLHVNRMMIVLTSMVRFFRITC